MIGERYGNDTETIRKRYGNDTGLIRKRYGNDTENISSELLSGLRYDFIVINFSGVNKSLFGNVSFRGRPL